MFLNIYTNIYTQKKKEMEKNQWTLISKVLALLTQSFVVFYSTYMVSNVNAPFYKDISLKNDGINKNNQRYEKSKNTFKTE